MVRGAVRGICGAQGQVVYGALLGPAIWFWIPCDSTAANMPGA